MTKFKRDSAFQAIRMSHFTGTPHGARYNWNKKKQKKNKIVVEATARVKNKLKYKNRWQFLMFCAKNNEMSLVSRFLIRFSRFCCHLMDDRLRCMLQAQFFFIQETAQPHCALATSDAIFYD